MSRAAGDVRPVTLEEPSANWILESTLEWVTVQAQPYLAASANLVYYVKMAVFIFFLLFFVMYIVRRILRSARISHYSR